ncbi:MAG: ABC transporter substrate-binding protein [Eubacteriales bacterium]|nr:ABC transporter substrate-binding protein [Eubacteriales bacterium]
MKKNIIIVLLLCALLLCGCGKNEPAQSGYTVTDMTDRVISLDAPATRIVALSASDCEILFALGAGDTLVGRGEYCDYPEAVESVPSVQSGYETNLEQIIGLEPQVVIMTKMGQTVEQVEALSNAGIAVVVSDAQDIDGVYRSIALIGSLVGKSAQADALCKSMKSSFENIDSKGDGTETIYFEVSPLEYGLWTAGSGTFMDELASLMGLKNAFSDVVGWAEISQEQVIARNPDYIVTIAMYYGEGATPVDEIMARAGWQDMTAIKNGKVFNADSNEISRPSPRLVNAFESLYEFVYGA